MDQQAIFLTFRLATLTTLILLAISIPLGYWLAYGRARWKPLVEAAVALPLVLPPTVLGFYLLVLMARALQPGGPYRRSSVTRWPFLSPGLCWARLSSVCPLPCSP